MCVDIPNIWHQGNTLFFYKHSTPNAFVKTSLLNVFVVSWLKVSIKPPVLMVSESQAICIDG